MQCVLNSNNSIMVTKLRQRLTKLDELRKELYVLSNSNAMHRHTFHQGRDGIYTVPIINKTNEYNNLKFFFMKPFVISVVDINSHKQLIIKSEIKEKCQVCNNYECNTQE